MIKPKLHLNSIIQSRTSFLLLGAVLALTINSFKSDVSRETKDSGDTREGPSKVRFFEHTHDGITHVHRAGAQPSRDNIVGLGGGRSAMLSGRQFAFNWRSISHLLLQQADRPDLFACVFTLDPSPE